ncbi:hypothetical protein [Streptomyces sp. SP18CS02]|uniref:hypothetical protein n=1 Tax=Streptomyces sp. SP18CS02 TaxID=3002531 RepID=UPI002E768A26|nr:hypothetical protein [Streptomyces sp. SP18CS02]MEE1754678.1 hypothetical protein [Streptomyces sp. SP18CS02]
MFVFVCAGCDAELTAPLSQVALPVHAHQQYGNGLQLPVLMEPGTFAVEPEPWGPPWRRPEETGPDEAAAHGVHGPVHALSGGVPGPIVIAPGDTRGAVLIPEKRGGACCGLAGGDGPNMACAACGLPVASRIDDCSLWQAVWLAPGAVRPLPVEADDAGPLSWAELMAEGKGVPPFEPITSWASLFGASDRWHWSPQWVAAAGQALAHLLAASEGRAVAVPDGLASEMFRRDLDALLPAGPPARRAVFAGPGLSAPDADARILLVPSHPRTGEVWAPRTGDARTPAASAYPVPLPFGVWLRLVFPEPELPVPASRLMPEDVLRDDPPAPAVHDVFRIDQHVFWHTLARLPAVRRPWLAEILAPLTPHPRAGTFQSADEGLRDPGPCPVL